MQPEGKPEPTSSPQWGCADLIHGFFILAFLGCIVFQFVRIPFRTIKGVRVEFEQNYRCEIMRGKVYWLHPEVAESLLRDKRDASFAPCEIYDRGWAWPAKCETHRDLMKPGGDDGIFGWLFNY